MLTYLITGGAGFIGSHMVKRLKSEGYWVRGVDLKNPEFSASAADDFIIGDLRNSVLVHQVLTLDAPNVAFDEIYQFAADMGGADLFLRVTMMRTLCITQPPLI